MAPLHPTHFLIVGTGATGLMTARELARAGKRVTILEARERCGGRIYPLPATEFGYPAEGGAEFVHGAAPVTRGLTREARLLLSRREGTRWSARTGALLPDQSSLPHAPARAGFPPRDDPTPPRPRRRNASHRFPGELAAKALAKEVSTSGSSSTTMMLTLMLRHPCWRGSGYAAAEVNSVNSPTLLSTVFAPPCFWVTMS